MGSKEPWPEKFRRLLREAAEKAGVEQPRMVVPKRTSGPVPRILPDRWHEPDVQRRLCVMCSLAIVGRMTLHEGKWCPTCWTFRILPNRRSEQPEPPRAA